MKKLPQEMIDFYKQNPEILEHRIYLEMVNLENYLEEFNLKHLTVDAFKKWNRIWELGRSYWQFPEEDDMKKMVNQLYEALPK